MHSWTGYYAADGHSAVAADVIGSEVYNPLLKLSNAAISNRFASLNIDDGEGSRFV